MHDAIAILLQEHSQLSRALDLLAAAADSIFAGERADAGRFERLVAFLERHAAGVHREKERALFEAIAAAKIGCPVAPRLREHADESALLAALRAHIAEVRGGAGRAEESLAETALEYVELSAGHMDKEEHAIYERAARELPRATLDALLARFESAPSRIRDLVRES